MFNFDNVIERRHTNSLKWDNFGPIYQLTSIEDILPMWVADMDFAVPQCVTTAITKRLEHPVFGYSNICDNTYLAIINWLATHHHYTVKKDELLFRHGVIPALANVIAALTKEGDAIVISPPVYHPFYFIPTNLNRTLLTCPLVEQNGHYHFDFDAFEQQLIKAKAYILCNPHNPGGMVWDEATLREIVRLCAKHDVLIISDEIHADLVFQPHQHIPIATVAGDEINRVITCMAPTKTFNLASIQSAFMIVHDANKRELIESYATANGQGGINVLAVEATRAAFEEGEEWRLAMLDYISHTMDVVIRELSTIDGVTALKPDGTYLLWIDYRATGLSEKEIMQRLLTVGKLALEPGTKYGVEGEGFLRMNLACPLATAEEAIARFKKALA
ncbi:cystathionine beta-lyase PatB [Lysinibacillus alkalisoli]|uniref:cysteine-S-conjugate beta-lyase n=1 Tax=Lysinibacillus alkalisoli TaxID=1911548 RepID=A0A917G6T3_9BACI|nr:MalY/PatB family protein [Lysinibacillus alkalisoli]GGG24709.1 cystathionine beta-lyase PatB [Lysinibacillus alkalisoli]